MEPIRLNRAPWAMPDEPSFQIPPDVQLARDEERKRILREEALAAQAAGDAPVARAAEREIARTRGGQAYAPTTDTIDNPLRDAGPQQVSFKRAPWEDTGPVQFDKAPWDGAPASKYDVFLNEPAAEIESPGMIRRGADLGTKLLSGVPRAGASITGLIGLIPGAGGLTDPAGKWLNEQSKAIDDALLSAYQLGKEKELAAILSSKDNFADQAKAAAAFLAENPGQIATTLAGSGAEILAGGLVGKGIKLGAKGVGMGISALTAGAAGEGALIAGGVSNQIAEGGGSYADRLYGIPAGLAGYGVSRLTGRLLGGADIDVALANRLSRGEVTDLLTPAGSTLGRVGKGVLGEGVLEEMPQSIMEQGATNLGLGRPFTENLGGAAAVGALSGGAMGGAFAFRRPGGTFTADELNAAESVRDDAEADPMQRLAAANFIRRTQIGTLGPEEADAQFAAATDAIMKSLPASSDAETNLLDPDANATGDYRETLAALRTAANDPDNPAVWRFPVSTGLETDSARARFAGGPGALNAAPNDANLTPAQIAALGGTAPLGLDQRTALTDPALLNDPRATDEPLTGSRALAAGGPSNLPSGGRLGISSSADGAALPGATVAPGALSTGAAPATATTTATKTTGTTTKAAKPAAPKAAKTIADALDDDLDLADRELDNARAKQIVDEVTQEDLAAQVQGEKGVKVAGRPTLGTQRLIAIRDGVLSKTGLLKKKGAAKDQAAVTALRRLMEAYKSYTDVATSIAQGVKTRAARSAENTELLDAAAAEVSAALSEVGQALDNNAKNVEAVVRVVKDAVQRKLAKPGTATKQSLAALQAADVALSTAWAASKRGTFRNEEVDLADVSGQQTRTSQEQQAKGNTISALERAAKEGYKSPRGSKEGDKYTGLAGVLQYLSFNTTPFGKVLAVALRNAITNTDNPVKVSFVDKSGSRYDPKTNTVYINRSEQSPEVVLHEALHAALQWFVYKHPNDPSVKFLERAVDRVLAEKNLDGKAKDVQDVLKKLVGNKRKLDAVLELVSYTATLNEFRRAVQRLEASGEQTAFATKVTAMWDAIKRIVTRMMGVRPSLASEILETSMDMLDRSQYDKGGVPESLTGKALDIATTAFRKWFGDSKIVDADGRPIVMYHGTSQDINTFRAKQAGAVFVTPDPVFAERFAFMSENWMKENADKLFTPKQLAQFAKEAKKRARQTGDYEPDILFEIYAENLPSNANIIPVYVKAENPFDYENEAHLAALQKAYESATGEDFPGLLVSKGMWSIIETADVQAAIKAAGFDGFYIAEGGRKNLAVYESNQLKSIFNQNPTEKPGILEAAVQSTSSAFKKWFGDSKVVDKHGKPLVVYHTSGVDVDQILSQAQVRERAGVTGLDLTAFSNYGIYFTPDPVYSSAYGYNKENPVTYPVYLRMNKPLIIRRPADMNIVKRLLQTIRIKSKIERYGDRVAHSSFVFKENMEALKAKGYDGIINYETDEYVVFDQNQIKSIYNLNPTEKPGILEAAVQSGQTPSQQQAGIPQPDDQNYTRYVKRRIALDAPMRFAFELFGFGRSRDGVDGAVTKQIKEKAGALADKIRKDFPALEEMILKFNPHFSSGTDARNANDRYKYDAQTGVQLVEEIVKFTENNQEQLVSLMKYMDGDAKALDKINDNGRMKLLADRLQTLYTQWIDALPANSSSRAFFQNRKFSEFLIAPEKISQVAGTSYGERKLKDMVGTRYIEEPTIDAFRDWMEDANGALELNKLYEVKKPDLNGDMQHEGFVSEHYLNTQGEPPGTVVDRNQTWSMSAAKGKKFKFSTRMTVADAIRARKYDTISMALMNTTAALSQNYASKQHLEALAQIGYENGKPSAQSVAFGSLKDINDTFKDRKVTPEQIITASDPLAASPTVRAALQRTGTWIKIPANSSTYGALAGMYLSGPVWNSILDMHDRSPAIKYRIFNDTMRVFKDAKTTKNPGTHVNNIGTNVTLAYLHGLPMTTLAKAARMYALYETNPNKLSADELKQVTAFMSSGAMLGEYTSTEAKETLQKAFEKALRPDSDSSVLTKLSTFAAYEKSKSAWDKFDSASKELYAAEDNIFRLASFLKTAGDIQLRDSNTGLSEEQLREAGLAARKMFLDYDIDSRAVRAARQSIMPFISWTYAVIPVLGRIALYKPWTLANVLLAYSLLAAAMGGDDDDEIRQLGPEYLRDRTLGGLGPYKFVRLPFMGDENNPRYMNLSRYVPFFSLLEPSPGKTSLAGVSWMPGFLSPSGPYVGLLYALGGYNPFTGKSIHEPTDTDFDKLLNTAAAVYDVFAPPAVNSDFMKKTSDLLADKKTDTGMDPDTLYLARKLGGLSVYGFNVDESLQKQKKAVKAAERDFKAAMNKAKKDEYAKGYPDYDALDEELQDLRERLEKRKGDILGLDLDEDE